MFEAVLFGNSRSSEDCDSIVYRTGKLMFQCKIVRVLPPSAPAFVLMVDKYGGKDTPGNMAVNTRLPTHAL